MSVDYDNMRLEVITEINKLRTTPKDYIPVLEKHISYFKNKILKRPGETCGIITQEGPEAYKEAIKFLETQVAVGELKLDPELSRASEDHVNDIGPRGDCSHNGSDDSDPSERMERYVEWNVTLCENIDFGAKSGEDIVISLLVDDGIADRGHRKNLFNPKIKYIGIACGDHKEYGICTVMDFVGDIISYKQQKLDSKAPKVSVNTKDNAKLGASKLANLMDKKLNVKEVVEDDPFKDDPDAPKDAVSCSIRTVTKTKNGKATKKIIKTYTLEDGSTEVVEIEEN